MLLILLNKMPLSEKSQTFIRHLEKHLERLAIKYSVSSFESTEFFIQSGEVRASIEERPLEAWTTIYPRKVGHQRGAAHLLAHLSEASGTHFIDPFHKNTKDASDIAKIVQMFKLATAGIRVPKTYFSPSYTESHIKNSIEYLLFPIVVKESNTSQGSGVFLAKNEQSLKDILRQRASLSERKEIFLQEFIPNSFEYRLLITGKSVAVAEKKVRSKNEEFRNNVHLGAKEEFIDTSLLEESVKKTALLAAKVTGIDIAGVDIVMSSNNQPVVFEVNSCPEFTLNEKISNEIEKLSEYLALCEKR